MGSYVQLLGTDSDTTDFGTLVITLAAAVPVGDSVFLACGSANINMTPTDSQGNSYAGQSGTTRIVIYQALITTALGIGDTISWQYNETSGAMVAGHFAGLDDAYDNSAGATGISAASGLSLGASITTARAGSMLIAGFGVRGSNWGLNAGDSGFTIIGSASTGDGATHSSVDLGYFNNPASGVTYNRRDTSAALNRVWGCTIQHHQDAPAAATDDFAWGIAL